jgi:hypothetical protein
LPTWRDRKQPKRKTREKGHESTCGNHVKSNFS